MPPSATSSTLVGRLHHDPIGPLLAVSDAALAWSVGRDLLGEPLSPQSLWALPQVVHMVDRQNDDGSWTYPGVGPRLDRGEDYSQLATYQQLLNLVSRYRLDRRHPAIERAADFLLGFQTAEGDIRGIYGSQYTPNYTGDMLGLCATAGLEDDPRVVKGIEWLLAMRQDDGGWVIPSRTVRGLDLTHALRLAKPVQPDRACPSSHLVTGIALRALAANRHYRHRPEAKHAARLLASRFFQPDRYPDHHAASCWAKLRFPFRWTDLVSALDSIALVGLKPSEPDVARGLRWLVSNQRPDGLWKTGYEKSPDPLINHWVTFAAARVFKRFFGEEAFVRSGGEAAPRDLRRVDRDPTLAPARS